MTYLNLNVRVINYMSTYQSKGPRVVHEISERKNQRNANMAQSVKALAVSMKKGGLQPQASR